MTMITMEKKSATIIRRHIPVALTVCLGILLSITCFYVIRHLEFRDAQAHFKEDALNEIEAIKRELEANIETVWSLKSFYLGSEEVTRDEFRTFVSYGIGRRPSIQALEWIPRVPYSQREAYETKARMETHPGFRITEKGAKGEMVRAAERKEYFPVYYVEPFKGNEIALGYDLASNPVRLKALHKSRDTGEMTATARITLVQEKEEQNGFLIFLPLYAKSAETTTVKERQENLNGFILGVYRIGEIVEKSLTYLEPSGIDIQLLDKSAPSGERSLYTHFSRLRDSVARPTLRPEEGPAAGMSYSHTLNVADRTWQITATPIPAFLSNTRNWHAPAGMTGIFLITVLTALYQHARMRRSVDRREAETALLESEQRFRTLVEFAPEAIVVLDLETGHFVDFNENALNLFGYPREALLKFGPIDLSPPLQPEGCASSELALKILQLAEAGDAPMFEWVHRNASGQEFPCEIRLVRLPSTKHTLIRGSITDITEKKRNQAALFAEKERAQVTLHSIGDAVISTDDNGHVDFLNPIAEVLTGWKVEEAKGRLLTDVFHIINEETREPAEDPVARCLREGKIVGLANHTILVSRAGKEYAIEDSAAPITSEKGELFGVVLVFKDVTEARRLSREVSYKATHDTLTGLINRAEFDRRLRRVLDTTKTNSTENALAYLDLDQFKLVNDTCGHVAGDELLRQIGQLLIHHIRKRDTLARLGGDEFGLLMEHCSLEEAQRVAENLIETVGDFIFPWEEHSFSVGVSIGLVSVDQKSNGIDGILSAADSACYMAKEQGRNRVHVHQEDDAELAKRHGEMQWAVRLPRALEEDRFLVYFQKIAPIQDPKSSQANHYELLLRMTDEKDSLVQPGTFLPAAERYNLSDRLDCWMINRAFRWLEAHQAHLTQLSICSLNLSGLSLSNKMLSQFVIQELEESGIPPEKICFEITETTAIANLSSATQFIKCLKGRGCRFALDDFGSGLSSFAYLKNLPVDFLKIDGLFVKDILDDPMDLAMVKSINEIGHIMGKQTIAEFVESDAILERLKEIGVDYVQGYGIGRPRPLDDVLTLP